MKAVGDQKRCSKCKRWLPLSEYANNRSASDGLQVMCNECRKSYYDLDKKRSYNRKYVDNNRERVIEYQRQYREAHPEAKEQAAERSRRHYQNNKEEHLEQGRRWHEDNPEKVRRSQRDYYYRNKEARLENRRRWARENPDKVAQQNETRRAREAGAAVEEINYKRIYKRDRDICYLCGRKVKKTERHLDHVVPLSRGGPHSEDNIRVTHARCNLMKGTKLVEELDLEAFRS